MYFDSHAHLTEDCFAQDFDTVVDNMKAASVTGMMEIGCDGPSSHHAVELAHQYDWIWAAVGSHPDDAEQVRFCTVDESVLEPGRPHRLVECVVCNKCESPGSSLF